MSVTSLVPDLFASEQLAPGATFATGFPATVELEDKLSSPKSMDDDDLDEDDDEEDNGDSFGDDDEEPDDGDGFQDGLDDDEELDSFDDIDEDDFDDDFDDDFEEEKEDDYEIEIEDEAVMDILIDIARRDTQNQSKFFANTLVKDFKGADIKLLKRPHRFANFAVLKAPEIPSVLVEAGFMSNKKEANKLNTSTHRKRIAKALKQGIDAYFKTVKENERS